MPWGTQVHEHPHPQGSHAPIDTHTHMHKHPCHGAPMSLSTHAYEVSMTTPRPSHPKHPSLEHPQGLTLPKKCLR